MIRGFKEESIKLFGSRQAEESRMNKGEDRWDETKDTSGD